MDGTLIDSTAGVVGAWETFADTYPGINIEQILNGESFLTSFIVVSLSRFPWSKDN
jgi:hypothetical protein